MKMKTIGRLVLVTFLALMCMDSWAVSYQFYSEYFSGGVTMANDGVAFAADEAVYARCRQQTFVRGRECPFVCFRAETRRTSATDDLRTYAKTEWQIGGCTYQSEQSVESKLRSVGGEYEYSVLGYSGLAEGCLLDPGTYRVTVTIWSDGFTPVSKSTTFQIVDSGISLAEGLGCLPAVNSGLISLSNEGEVDWFGRSGESLSSMMMGISSGNSALTGCFASGAEAVLTVKGLRPAFATYRAKDLCGSGGGRFTVVSNLDTRGQTREVAEVCPGANGYEGAFLWTDGTLGDTLSFVYDIFGWGGAEVPNDRFFAGQVDCLDVRTAYKVTFDSNGGSGCVANTWTIDGFSYDYVGGKVLGFEFPDSGPALPPQKYGLPYTFEGWYYGEKRVTGSTIFHDVRGNHILKAKWKEPERPNMPDLIVAGGLVTPQVIYRSQNVSLSLTVRNAGVANAGASVVWIQIGNALWCRDIPALSPGAASTQTYQLAGSMFSPGTYTVKLAADGNRTVTESDENNNETVVGTLTVVRDPVDSNYDFQYKKRKSSDPDTAWLSTSLSGTKATTSFKLGEPIYIQLGFWNAKRVAATKTIYVQADLAKAGGSRMNYYGWYWPSLGKDVVGYITDEYRKPPMLQNLKEGSYVLTLTLDYTDAYSETDELNNIKTISFSVYDPTPKPTTYTIEFKADGGSGTMSSLSCAPNKVYALTRCAFKRSGKSFRGWKGSNGRRYDDGMLVFDLAKPGETVTMTAVWE